LFIEEFVNTDPKHENWVNPWGLWWTEYERRFGTEDISPAELLWGLQEIAGAEIETEENERGQDTVLVYGVSL